MSKKDERNFEEVVQSIVRSEADVDKILEAAKLDRHERPDNRLSAEQKCELIGLGMIIFAVVAFVVVMFLPIIVH